MTRTTTPPDEILSAFQYDPTTGFFTHTRSCRVSGRADHAGSKGYMRVWFGDRHYFAHRLAWYFTFKVWPVGFIDHKDGNKTNNSIENLRLATNSQNQMNRKSKTPFKGVTFHKKVGKFQAQINIAGRYRYLGLHETPEQAHQAYADAAKLLCGEFARMA